VAPRKDAVGPRRTHPQSRASADARARSNRTGCHPVQRTAAATFRCTRFAKTGNSDLALRGRYGAGLGLLVEHVDERLWDASTGDDASVSNPSGGDQTALDGGGAPPSLGTVADGGRGGGSSCPISISPLLRGRSLELSISRKMPAARLSISDNRREWRKNPGTNKRRPRVRTDADVIARQDEALRIVDEDTWEAVQARLRAVSAHYTKGKDGAPKGRSVPGRATRYLFSRLPVQQSPLLQRLRGEPRDHRR